MKINFLLIFVALISLIISSLIIIPITSEVINKAAVELSAVQVENMKQIVANSIDQKRFLLRNFAQIISSDTNLSAAYILAQESNDFAPLEVLIQQLRIKTQLDYIELLPNQTAHSPNQVIEQCLHKLDKDIDETICEENNNVLVGTWKPITLYGRNAGILFLGINLQDNKITSEHSSYRLSMTDFANLGIEIYKLGNKKVYGMLQPDTSALSKITRSFRASMIGGATLALLLMVNLLIMLMHFVFFRPFKQVLSAIDQVTKKIQMNEISDLPLKGGVFAAEIQWLIERLKVFIDKMRTYQVNLAESSAQLTLAETQSARWEVARQVAHDIRSPLTALNFAIADLNKIPESYRGLLSSAVNRINGIANELLNNSRKKTELTTEKTTPVYDQIKNLIKEKEISLKNSDTQIVFNSSIESCDFSIQIPNVTFQNIMSNLINNAIEAIAGKGKITIDLAHEKQNVLITISDNGPGIPEPILKKLGEVEISYGKEDGNGLGVKSAFSLIKKANGSLRFDSTLGQGTKVLISLPGHKLSPSTEKTIMLKKGHEIVIIDDDKAMHELWQHRLNEVSVNNTLLISHMVKPDDFELWISNNPNHENFQFFIDYQFHNSSINGLDLISKYGLQSRAILVTAHYQEPDVVALAHSLNVNIFAKPNLTTVKFEIL